MPAESVAKDVTTIGAEPTRSARKQQQPGEGPHPGSDRQEVQPVDAGEEEPAARRGMARQAGGDGKPGGACRIVLCREDLMQLRACHAVPQPRIDRSRITLQRRSGSGDALEMRDKGGRVVHRCSCNVLCGQTPSGI